MEVTVSGVPRERRRVIQAAIEQLRGVYSGALVVGRTAAVVTEGAVDFAAPKLVVARQNCIPIVTSEWLWDSQQHGFLLNCENYAVEEPAAPPDSVTSTTAAAAPPATTAAGDGTTGTWRATGGITPASPSPEKLRGEADPPQLCRFALPFLEQACGAALPKRGTPPLLAASKQPDPSQHNSPVLVRDAVHQQPPSPVQPLDTCRDAAGSPLLPQQLAPAAELELSSGPASPLSALHPGSIRSSEQPSAATCCTRSSGLEGSALLSSRTGRSGTAATATDATPSGTTAQTDSDTKVARLLSWAPHVTLGRGTCMRFMPGILSPTSSRDGGGSSCSCSSSTGRHARGSSLEGRSALRCMQLEDDEGESPGTGGATASASCASPSDLHQGSMKCVWADADKEQVPQQSTQETSLLPAAAHCDKVEERTHTPNSHSPTPAAAASACAESQGGPLSGGHRRWYTESVVRMRSPLSAGGLPATTLIRLGLQLQHPPAYSTMDGIAEWHGGCDGQHPRPKFYAWAQALPEGGTEMQFVAGDSSHGARILYDVQEDGQRLYALTLVQSIYMLGDEAWMEHRYLFSREDMLEREAWSAAGRAMKPGEVLVSAGSYHSPMHLVDGEFRVSYPGRVTWKKAGQGAAGSQQPAPLHQEQLPVYTCRRGFDAATGAVVPLRHALQGFAAP